MTEAKDYFLYVLLCDQKILYTGIAIDPKTRLAQHQQGHPYGAKFTRRFKKLEIVYQVKVGNRATAQSIETKVKKCSSSAKQTIISKQFDFDQLVQFIQR